jgi:adenylate kinase
MTTMTIITQLKDAMAKRALYVKTRDEIAKMPLDVALDLDIYPGDAERIAHDAVYGKAA